MCSTLNNRAYDSYVSAEDPAAFQREASARQSMSAKRHAYVDAKNLAQKILNPGAPATSSQLLFLITTVQYYSLLDYSLYNTIQ